MRKSNDFQNGIFGLIERAKLQNPIIGDYIEHYLHDSMTTENSFFRVTFSNGKLNIFREWARVQEVTPDFISKENIKQMADSFELIESVDNEKVEDSMTENLSTNTVSLWQRILKIFGLQ